MTLSSGQVAALNNLERKHAGQDVDFINIADARSLTDLGLAIRTREGWEITDAGLLAINAPNVTDRTNDGANDIIPLHPR
jgi:hypothetical protein